MFLYYNGKTGYNNLVDTLNTLSKYYINTLYANNARNLETDPSNPTDQYTILEDRFITEGMNYKDSSVDNSLDYTQLTDEMRNSPQKEIWTSGRLALYGNRDPSTGTQPYYYFYGSRVTAEGKRDTYGQWLVCHYEDGKIVESKNDTNGVRPIIKLNYDIKLEKTTDSNGNILWHIID